MSAEVQETQVATHEASGATEFSHMSDEQWMTLMKRHMSKAMGTVHELQEGIDAYCQETGI
eukprot:12936560-Prorocentrum_lima.AAC.1